MNAKAREHTSSWEAAAYREGAVACRSAGSATVRMGTNTRPTKKKGTLCCGTQSVRKDQQHAECVKKYCVGRGAGRGGVGLGWAESRPRGPNDASGGGKNRRS